jgi:hypothetical protein
MLMAGRKICFPWFLLPVLETQQIVGRSFPNKGLVNCLFLYTILLLSASGGMPNASTDKGEINENMSREKNNVKIQSHDDGNGVSPVALRDNPENETNGRSSRPGGTMLYV